MTTYDFTKTPVSSDRLTLEIVASAIVTALDHISVDEDQLHVHFKASLSGGDETILGDIVTAHTGEALPDPILSKRNANNAIIVDTSNSVGLPGASSITLNSHDWSDRTTWYQRSVAVANETLTDSGNGLLFNSAHPHWINIDSDRLTYDYGVVPERDGSFSDRALRRVEVKVGGVVAVPVTDYSINFVTGAITFTGSQTGNVVTASYYHNDGVSRRSEWVLNPPATMAYLLNYIEIQFSKNVVFDSAIFIEIWAGADVATYDDFSDGLYAAGYGQNKSRYRGAKDFMNICTNRSSQILPAFGGLSSDVLVFPFDYLIQAQIKSSQGAVIVLSLEDDVAYTVAELSTVTFYMQIVPETSL